MTDFETLNFIRQLQQRADDLRDEDTVTANLLDQAAERLERIWSDEYNQSFYN